MYPAKWHQGYGDKTGLSAGRILPDLLRLFGTESLLEVGCGNAHWTRAAIEAGVRDYTVVDGPWNDRDHLLVERENFVEADLSRPLLLPRRFDMAICLEVAEHLHPGDSDTLINSLTAAADVIVFGAAIPLQGGFGHHNEQWPSWWRDKFRSRGFVAFDLVRPKHWNDDAIHYWYRQNTFVFVNQANEKHMAAASEAELLLRDTNCMYDAVHPEKFYETASYDNIAIKRLVRKLPRWLGSRAMARLGRGK